MDKYGRLLAYLYRVPGGLFVNLEIVRQGYGHAYTEYPFEYMETFRDYERRAREAGKGLWAPEEASGGSTSRKTTEPAAQQNDADEATVYVTKTGRKYHREGCTHLSHSKTPLSIDDANDRGYGPCRSCGPPE